MMPGKFVLRAIQFGLLLVVAAVIAFGRKSPESNPLVPAQIPGTTADSPIVLRREPMTMARPYARKLVEVPPQGQASRPPAPTSTPLPLTTNPYDGQSMQIPPELQVRRHRIVEGDTIQDLARSYLGDAGRYQEIVAANSQLLVHPEVLPLGRYLIIPPAAAATNPGIRSESTRPLLPVR